MLGGSFDAFVSAQLMVASDNCLRLLVQAERRAASRADWTAGRRRPTAKTKEEEPSASASVIKARSSGK